MNERTNAYNFYMCRHQVQAAMTLLKAFATTSTSYHLVVGYFALTTSAVFYVLLLGEGVVFCTLLVQVISLITRLKSRLLQPPWTVSELDHDILSDNSYSH